MCIIAYKPAGKTIDKQTLDACFSNNPDGAGFMFPCEGRVLIRKGYFTFGDFWAAWEKTHKIYGDNLPVVFHFRIATAGKIDKTNCHPHRITQDLAFVHNGILTCVNVPKKSKISDTILYRDVYLRKMSGLSLHEKTLFKIMGKHIGTHNKFVFMNGKGKVAFANEKSGVWDRGVWYSNTSYTPRITVGDYKTSDWWNDYHYCEFCGKDLDTPEERTEGLCFSCLDYDSSGYEECGGCRSVLTDAVHKVAGWCDACGKEMYGDTWADKLDECAAEETNMENTID